MAELSSTIEEEFLTCKICLEVYVEPKVLPCLHTFCLGCISRHFEKTRKGCKACCPLCRTMFEVPDCQPMNMKTNFYINSLAEVIGAKKNSAKHCSFCEMKNVVSASRWICIQCMDFLCETCKQNHQGTRLTFNHQTISIEQLLTGDYDQVIRKRTDITCSEHENEKVRFFCETCLITVCRDCVLLKHKDHTYRSPADAMQDRREEMVRSLRAAEDQVNTLEENQTFITESLSDLNKSEICQITSLKSFGKMLKDAIDQNMEETERKIRETSEESRGKLTERSKSIALEAQVLKEPLELCKDLLENGRDEEILYFRESFKEVLQNPNTHGSPRSDLPWERVEIVLSETMVQLVKEKSIQINQKQQIFSENRSQCIEMQITEDNNHKDTPQSLSDRSYSSVIQPSSSTQRQVNSGIYRLINTFNCYIGCKTEFVPEPTGVAWISSRQIAVCDGENKQLKVFKRNGHTDWFVDIETTPTGISVVENKIVVAVPYGVLIYQNGTRTGVITCKVDTFRHVASSSLDILLFPTDGEEVRRYDSKGKRRGTIMLETPLQPLTVSCNDELIVVSDKRSSEPLMFNYNGEKLRSVQRNKANWLADAHCLQKDRVLLVNKQSSKVVILQDGEKYLGGWSTEPEITRPSCIDYHSDGLLVIGGAGGNIAVYQFL
ncbi:E3 ubiquitin-protein ligase TRIM56-like [Mizuhopecten yessoensis]|uniref:E3 ubiquitin-protein ligase TRIM56 n=1 Tax=Mizuhopecten yessoensis TaxID=6573 RepID=A0A210R445_MIZYE|nr:E3 ubiquitin-protein ligase TRIM56-like [Mizuhopecten yessoensis]OWF55674.1 E3 ubiquitin-protein ligase TRIM56 [Mizuhopecten yessoensis]